MTVGLIFDVDGVIVDSPHEKAWGESLRRLFSEDPEWRVVLPRTRYRPEDYSSEVYLSQAAGKPRSAGARALLDYYGVPDPDGRLLARYMEHKQEVFLELVDAGDFRVFDDAVDLILEARADGARLAAASSSKNANRLLQKVRLPASAGGAATLLDVFDGNVCGRDFPRGKPAPDIFLAAAESIGLGPEHCAVFEDAVSGVAAARAGGFYCVGVARLGDDAQLAGAGADRVVNDLHGLWPSIRSVLENPGDEPA